MGTPQVQKQSNLVKTSSGSGSADIKNINSSQNINIFGSQIKNPSFARISPSNLNVGKNVSVMDQKMGDSIFLAYGNDNCKYINPNYDLSDKYNTNNYLQPKESGFSKFMKIMGGVMAGGMALSTLGGLLGLFGGNKNKGAEQAQSEQQDGTEQTTRTRGTEQSNAINDAVSGSKALLKSTDKNEVEDGIDALSTSIADAQSELDGIDGKIASAETEAGDCKKREDVAEGNYNEKRSEVKTQKKTVDSVENELNKATTSEERASKTFENAKNAYDLAKSQLAKMDTSDPQYATAKAKVDELLKAKNDAQTDLEIKSSATAELQKKFGEESDKLEALTEEEAELLNDYNEAKTETQNAEQEVKDLKYNKSHLEPKIKKAEDAKQKLESRLEALNIREGAGGTQDEV